MIKLSFLIPVKNQSQLLKKCVESIIAYAGNDIEIVISDNCSEEDLETLLNSLDDNRIKYFRNEEDVGHDRNILRGFQRCAGEYVYLLRTKDHAIADTIPKLLKVLEKTKDLGFITGTAIAPDGNIRIGFKADKLLKKGEETLEFHRSHLWHPSGCVFRKDVIDVKEVDKFLCENIDCNVSFLADDLMRVYIAEKKDFYIMHEPFWIYEYTHKAITPSANIPRNKEYVYSPELNFQRMKTQMKWARKKLAPKNYINECIRAFRIAYRLSTWNWYIANKYPERGANHYGIIPQPVNINKVQKDFLMKLRKEEKDNNLTSFKYKIQKMLFIARINTIERLKVQVYYKLLFENKNIYQFRMKIDTIYNLIKKNR